MKRQLRMVAVVYLPMEDGETQEQAEDRVLELIEAQGMNVYAYEGASVIERADNSDHPVR